MRFTAILGPTLLLAACTEAPRPQPLPPGSAGADMAQPDPADLTGVANPSVDLVAAAPAITSITPKLASTAGNSEVTIQGFGFSNRSQVFIGNAAAPVTSASADRLVVRTPPSLGLFGPQTVIVRNPDGLSGSNAGNPGASFSYYPSKLAFSAGTAFVTSGHPLGVDVGDFNEDGLNDFVSVSDQDYRYNVFSNQGGGNFLMVRNDPACSLPHYVRAVDINKDGHVDIGIACYSNNMIRFWMNSAGGDGKYGNFSSNRDTPANQDRPTIFETGDVDGDGDLDVISTGIGSYITVWKNDGQANPSFSFHGTFGVNTSSNYGIAVGDLNNDGKLDVAVTNLNNYCLSVLIGDGNGSFGSRSDFCGLTYPRFVRIADLNGDNYPEILTARYQSHDLVVFRNNNGSFSDANRSFFPLQPNPHELRTGDFNGDGIIDVAVVNEQNAPSNRVSLLLGKGDGTFFARQDFITNSYSALNLAVGDVNGDKMPDFLVAQRGSSPFSINVLFNQSQ